MLDKKTKIINLGVSLIAMIVIICISVTITVMARPLYYFDIEYLEIPWRSGVSAEACKLNYDTLIDYNLLGGEDELVFPTLKMSETGRIHFEEVKDIFIKMQVIAILGVIVALGFAVFIWRKSRLNRLEKDSLANSVLWMKYAFPVTVWVALAVGLAMAIDWEWAFTTMHQIFFNNNYWIFNPDTDPVIKILPEEFFFHCGLMIVTLTMVQIVALRVIYRRLTNG